MKKTFIRTKNVKQFVSLMDELQKVPPNIPKMALVYPINLCQFCFDFRKPLNSLYGKKENINHYRG